jgi:hypothetical protein
VNNLLFTISAFDSLCGYELRLIVTLVFKPYASKIQSVNSPQAEAAASTYI